MQFGLALDFGTQRAPLNQVVDEYMPIIKLAERYGFGSVWAGESYPARPGSFHLPSPLLVLASLAPRTSLKLGTGVTLVPAWHPVRLAYDCAILDQLSGGRLILGVGIGQAPLWQRFGVDPTTVATLMDETLAALRALWSGEPGYRGTVVTIENGIAPLPTRPGGPPLWVGGRIKRSAARSAAFGDAYYAATQHLLTEIGSIAELYREALAERGRDPATAIVSANRLAFAAETPERAQTEGSRYVEHVIQQYAAMGGLRALDGSRLPAGQSDLLSLLGDEVCLVGSPETICAQLERYERAGVTHIQLRVAPADLPLELVIRTVTLFGEEIAPHFATRAP